MQLYKHKRCAVCPVHKRRADKGVAEVYALLRELLPDAGIIGEFPLMSVNGVEGRAHCTGMFMKGPDFWIDLVVQHPTKQWLGIEVCGLEHLYDKLKQKRDDAKLRAAQAVRLPLLKLWLKDGQPDSEQWRVQLERTLKCL